MKSRSNIGFNYVSMFNSIEYLILSSVSSYKLWPSIGPICSYEPFLFCDWIPDPETSILLEPSSLIYGDCFYTAFTMVRTQPCLTASFIAMPMNSNCGRSVTKWLHWKSFRVGRITFSHAIAAILNTIAAWERLSYCDWNCNRDRSVCQILLLRHLKLTSTVHVWKT